MRVQKQAERLQAISAARAAVRDGRLRDLRERMGLSQRELGHALGVDTSAVSRWESGDRMPREAQAVRLHGLLRVLEGGP